MIVISSALLTLLVNYICHDQEKSKKGTYKKGGSIKEIQVTYSFKQVFLVMVQTFPMSEMSDGPEKSCTPRRYMLASLSIDNWHSSHCIWASCFIGLVPPVAGPKLGGPKCPIVPNFLRIQARYIVKKVQRFFVFAPDFKYTTEGPDSVCSLSKE